MLPPVCALFNFIGYLVSLYVKKTIFYKTLCEHLKNIILGVISGMYTYLKCLSYIIIMQITECFKYSLQQVNTYILLLAYKQHLQSSAEQGLGFHTAEGPTRLAI